MTSTFANGSTSNTEPITLEKLTKAMQEIDLLPRPTEWVLLSPDGRMYRGRADELLQVLLPHHPIMQLPSQGLL